MATYGKTYWGQQFLNALENIDYSNRLPRGRSYASNGSVRNIAFDKNIIIAKVKGSRPKPYDINIVIPEFTKTQKDDLINAIQNNHSILASMLNRKLPNELLDIALKKNIKIFPKEWKDFKMNCSCPDWAVPCKHLAAVIYIIANEIDLNPFKVLELHGLDVISELSKSGTIIEDNTKEKIENWNDFFSTEQIEYKENITNLSFDELDFSLIPKIEDKFLNLLTPNPPFYEKDLKKELLTHFKYFTKQVDKHFFNLNENKIKLDYCLDASIIFLKKDSKFVVELLFENISKQIQLIELFRIFNNPDSFKLANLSESLKVLYHLFLLSKKLIEQGAIIPMLTQFNENYQINWTPLLQDSSVKLQISILNKYSKFVKIINEGKRGKNTYFTTDENFSFFIISIFTTAIVDEIIIQNRRISLYDNILHLFFGKPIETDISAKEIFNSIQLWLSKLQIHKRNYVPVLEIEEKYPDFNIALNIKEFSKDKITSPIKYHLFKKKNKKQIISVIKELQHLQEHFPEFNKIINSDEQQHLTYNSEKFAEFLFQISPVLQLLGVELLLPNSLKYIVKPMASLKASSSGKKDIKTYLDLMSILHFDWQVAIGDELLTEKDFLKLVSGLNGIIKIKNQFVHITKEEIEKLLKHLQNPAPVSKHQMLQVLFANEYNGAKIEVSDELLKILNQFNSITSVPLPAGLNAEMRPYQLRGYEWLYKNSKIGFGSILADDMGLGKTLQTIAILLKFKEDNILEKEKALIVMPTTLLTNWDKEFQKFAPSLSYHIYHGSKRDISKFDNQDILLTSYGIARTDSDIIKKIKWHVLIIDEAQNIKNHNADQTKAIKSINSNIKIALSGTPVENRLSEYWSIFDFSNKGYLGSIKHFTDEFSKPITIEKSHKQLEVFKKITSPFIMRRMKSDKSIISDLPDKIENNQYSSLTKQQAALYESTVKNVMKTIEESEGIERKGLVLKMLTALKQIGNHPYQYLKSGANSAELSGKIVVLFELLNTIIDNNEKTLIFTQYKEMGDLLQILIREELETEPLFLHGSLTRQQRETMIEEFQTKQFRKIFILSLKAGGTGLNLAQAQNVIHYDLWWNPAVEIQATDRAYRIGQKNKVMVHRLINKGTMEERIDAMINEKKQLADLTVSSGEKWLGELSNKELKELVKLTKEE